MDDEGRLVQRIQEQTGMDVAISGFLDRAPAAGAPRGATLGRARPRGGAPKVTLPHVGWEWTPGSRLLTLPFAPKMMLDELKAFMNE
jgi:hypothetical protein